MKTTLEENQIVIVRSEHLNEPVCIYEVHQGSLVSARKLNTKGKPCGSIWAVQRKDIQP